MEIILSGKVPNRNIIEKYIEDKKEIINEMASTQNKYLSQPEKIYVRYHGQDRKFDIYKGQSRSQLKKIGSLDNPWQEIENKSYSKKEIKAMKIELLEHIKEDPTCMAYSHLYRYEVAEKVLSKKEFDKVRREAIFESIKEYPTHMAIPNITSYKVAEAVLSKKEFDKVRREAIFENIKESPTCMACSNLCPYNVAEEVLSKEEFDAIRRDALHKWIEQNPTGLVKTDNQNQLKLAKELFTKYEYSRQKGDAIIKGMSE